MSLDRSLKGATSLIRHRNVLKRGERLLRLADVEKWDESKAVLGLPKVGNRKLELGKAEPKAADAADATATPAAGAKGAPAAKGAAPAAGAKGAAPAAKGAAPAAKGAPAAKAAAPAAKKK